MVIERPQTIRDAGQRVILDDPLAPRLPQAGTPALIAQHRQQCRLQGGDIVGQLLRSFEEVRGDEIELLQLQPHFQTLLAKVGDALEDEALDFNDPDELRRLLSQSENLLLAELLGGEA